MEKKKLHDLILRLTTSGQTKNIADQEDMKHLKKACKAGGPLVITDVFRLLMNQLEKKQSQVRLSTLLVMDEIFCRSHCFRSLLLSQESFDLFLNLIGMSCSPSSSSSSSAATLETSLPPPAEARKLLKAAAIQILDKWNNSYANGYTILSSACNFLSQHRGVSFSGRQVRAPHVAAAQVQADERKKRLLKEKMERACQRFDELSREIESSLKQAEEAIQLLVPSECQMQESLPLHLYDYDREVSDCSHPPACPSSPQRQEMQEHAVRKDVEVMISISDAGSRIQKTADNQDIIASIKDQYKLLIRIFLPKLKILMKSFSQGVEFCEETLKRAIDLKNDALITITKMSELRILRSETGDADAGSSSNGSSPDPQDEDSDDNDFVEVPEKEGLQLVIPQHERHLYGLDDGLQDQPSSSPSSKSQSTRCCRAPLPSGKLCPRRDLLKCPFHGVIIERDPTGVPVKEEERLKEEQERADRVPEWQDPAFLRDLEAATGLDLTVNRHKRRRNTQTGVKSEAEVARMQNPKERIMQRVFAKQSRQRVARDMDGEDAANHKQYEDNWSYALNT